MEPGDYPVLVTGASGYIATHIVQQLQEAGHKVHGTVRSLANEEKVAPLRNLAPSAKYPIELFEADLLKEDGWKQAVDGCRYVLHTASPFPNEDPRDENELIRPAVDGTLTVLRACRGAGVKRVVLTSSIAAMSDGTVAGTITEKDWIDVEKAPMAYYKSKALAEKAAWDFVKELNDMDRFELAVINPSFVMGPVLCGGLATSFEVTKRMLERAMPALPHLYFNIVDVREVAAAHVAAMTQPDAAGERHIASSHALWMKDIARVYDEEFKPQGYSVPTREAPYIFVKFLSFFDKTIKMILPNWGQVVDYDNSRMKNVLKVQPRAAKETILDMGYSMIEKGLVKKTAKFKSRSAQADSEKKEAE